jgi:hypothetical protein
MEECEALLCERQIEDIRPLAPNATEGLLSG